ncbi:G-type lectin S-receptor-like serine/threonine-protein kinase LECRK4 [Camellia sinensis]|uniref:G-type lectin S-receptor-like serine/threonine-protein kinase LECRK4 n=1 Tax=Camellia sinensis TaxID=4442 RepID=UPI0010369BF8|nr:G-type lectin S-receptor-like serine/threonine-protein kinase LECRK4 [Camellia sinensis]
MCNNTILSEFSLDGEVILKAFMLKRMLKSVNGEIFAPRLGGSSLMKEFLLYCHIRLRRRRVFQQCLDTDSEAHKEISKKRQQRNEKFMSIQLEKLTMQLFSYSELKKATNGFKEELGKGSFGAVYKGTLYKGKMLIAMKRLEKVVEEGEREFQAEMRVIGRRHHRNLVPLLGYCIEGSKRLLVYEYMSNGSLAELLFKSTRRPDWKERIGIALNVARGILYLYEECETPIIHCDIKPQNILIDEFWNAKTSDFGLSKLLMPDQMRTFTGVRGTTGYLAQEWCFVGRELNKFTVVGDEEVHMKTLENMVKVGLWCIQDEPTLRPSMKSVVMMLEGITDISIPSCRTTY